MNLSGVYFSPTENTRKVINYIAKGIGKDLKEYNMSMEKNRINNIVFNENDLVIIGCPVYVGRVPVLENEIFSNIKGNKTLCILVISYGNREYEDSLLELKNIVKEKGFIPIAAGAFIGEHSYSREIATNRPNEKDLKEIILFGEKIKEKIDKGINLNKDLNVSGNYPYRDIPNAPKIAPSANNNCVNCGKCIDVCPTSAISKKDPTVVNNNKCIRCFACVRICPLNARDIEFAPFKEKIESIKKICLSREKQIEIFL